jgi:type II secretory pathway component PulF
MSLLWITGLCLLAVVWVLSIVDIIRHHYSGWTTVAWLALIVILPFIGSLIYWRCASRRARTPSTTTSRRPSCAAKGRGDPSTARG